MNASRAHEAPSEEGDLEFPPMWSSSMTPTEVLAWASDIAQLCRVEEVRVKGGTERRSEASRAFSDAVHELTSRRVTALQVRYLYRERMYFDTCLSDQGGYRLVRLLLPQGSRGP